MTSSRTWIASTLFLDIVGYTKFPVNHQVEVKNHFLKLISLHSEKLLNSESIHLDTGDGMALCYIGDPEAIYPVANKLYDAFSEGDAEFELEYTVRLGLNLGPIKLVDDINGKQNCLGSGINDAQRVMDFAKPNELLVSESYFDVVSKISDNYSKHLTLQGTHLDKHNKEHVVYRFESKPNLTNNINETSAHQSISSKPSDEQKNNHSKLIIESKVEEQLLKELASCIGSESASQAIAAGKESAASLLELCQILSEHIQDSEDRYSFDKFTKTYGYSGY